MFGCINERGVCVGTYARKTAAKKYKALHNARAREQKERGDIASLRYIVGIARMKPGK